MQALSANQDLLVRNEWKGVEIKGLVHAQLAHFADLIGSRILVEGPRSRVKASAAQAIGLALHELATNSGKYGALSTDMGRVDIRWGTDGEFTMSLDRAGRAAHICTAARRVRHDRRESDGRAQRGRSGRS
jgi:two-component sensor histidine kinase